METCSMQNFSFEFSSLSGLSKLQSLDLTHVDRMCGSPHWRKDVRETPQVSTWPAPSTPRALLIGFCSLLNDAYCQFDR